MLQPSDKLSSDFWAYEFAQKVGQLEGLPEDPEICHNLAKLAAEGLQPLRNAWERFIVENSLGGSPVVKVICGWRSPAHNQAVGGALKSQHMLGLAADIACDVDWRALRRGLGTLRDAERMERFVAFVEKHVDKTDRIGGLGLYYSVPSGQPYWVHVDIRPRINGHVARWTGGHVGDEQ